MFYAETSELRKGGGGKMSIFDFEKLLIVDLEKEEEEKKIFDC